MKDSPFSFFPGHPAPKGAMSSLFRGVFFATISFPTVRFDRDVGSNRPENVVPLKTFFVFRLSQISSPTTADINQASKNRRSSQLPVFPSAVDTHIHSHRLRTHSYAPPRHLAIPPSDPSSPLRSNILPPLRGSPSNQHVHHTA